MEVAVTEAEVTWVAEVDTSVVVAAGVASVAGGIIPAAAA